MAILEFEIGGKKRGFRFGTKFLGDVFAHYDCNFADYGGLLGSNPYKTLPTSLYFAAKAWDRSKGIPVDYSIEDFEYWIEDLGWKEPIISEITLVIMETLQENVDGLDDWLKANNVDMKAAREEVEAKKKLTGK